MADKQTEALEHRLLRRPTSPQFRIAITRSVDVEGQAIWSARIAWGEALADFEHRITKAEGFPTRKAALQWANGQVLDRMVG